MRARGKSKKEVILEALRRGQLTIGYKLIDCTESLITSLAASNTLTRDRAEEHLKMLRVLRVGRKSVNETSSDIKVSEWSQSIDDLNTVINNDIAIAKRRREIAC